MSKRLPTRFLPAERSSPEEILGERASFLSLPRLCELLHAMPNLVFVLNPHRQVLFANRAVYDLLKGRAAGLIGSRLGEAVDCVHARETEGGCGTTEACSACGIGKAFQGALQDRPQVRECRIRLSTGGEDLNLMVWTHRFIAKGHALTLLAGLDIRSEKRYQALERLFFHDVLNTAACIEGLSQMLAEADPGSLPAISRRLADNARRLIEEITSQKDLAAMENGEYRLELARFRAAPFLKALVDRYRALDVARGKTLQLAAGLADVTLTADHALLSRVVGNMVKNALEAEKEGNTVTVGCRREGSGRVCFWVRNPAVMPRPIQLQMFQRFFSTKGPGRGLGTYSIKLLTERYLRGTAAFSSAPGRGTEFRAVIPLLPPDGLPTAEPPSIS